MGLTKGQCVEMLNRKYEETGVYPKKSDFSEEEVTAVKSYFGPWPRALEAAGIKEAKPITKKEQRQQKRILKKRAINAKRKIMKKQNVAEKKGKEEI